MLNRNMSVLEHIKFLAKATNQHGVHSPFVYDLVTKCLYDKKQYPEYLSIKTYRTQLNNNHNTLHFENSNTTKISFRISDLIKSSGMTFKRSKILFRLARYSQWKTVLELGNSLGIATQAISLGQPNAQIVSLVNYLKTSKETTEFLDSYQNIKVVNSPLNEIISKYHNTKFDAVFINHHYNLSIKCINQLFSITHNDTVIIINGLYQTQKKVEIWKYIKNHPKVTVTIDNFYWGLIFFRREQRKQHFKIRL